MKVGSTVIQIGHVTYAREIRGALEVYVAGQRVPYVSRPDEAAVIKMSLKRAGFINSDINWINVMRIAAVELVGEVARIRFLGTGEPMILHAKLAEPVLAKIHSWEDAWVPSDDAVAVPAPDLSNLPKGRLEAALELTNRNGEGEPAPKAQKTRKKAS